MRKAIFSLVLFLLYFYFAVLFSPWLVARFLADRFVGRIGWSAMDWEDWGRLQHA